MTELSLAEQERMRVLARTKQRRDEVVASVARYEAMLGDAACAASSAAAEAILANERVFLATLEQQVEELSNG